MGSQSGRILIHPLEGIEKPQAGKSRDRALSDQEFARVWQACDGVAGNVVKMLVLTGCSREEIVQLTWCEIVGDEVHLPGHAQRMVRPRSSHCHPWPKLSSPALHGWKGLSFSRMTALRA